jgi:hypothetical protein
LGVFLAATAVLVVSGRPRPVEDEAETEEAAVTNGQHEETR